MSILACVMYSTWSPYCDAKEPSCVETEQRKNTRSADQELHRPRVWCVSCDVYLRSAAAPPYRLWSQTCSSYWCSQTCRRQRQIRSSQQKRVLSCTSSGMRTHWDFLFLLGTSSLIFCSPTKMRWDSLKSLRRMGEQMSSSFLTMWTNGEPADLGPEQKHSTLMRIRQPSLHRPSFTH